MPSSNLPQTLDPTLPLFTVTVAARLAEMHPQTLRGYERLGLVIPSRTKGRARRYSLNDIVKLRHIQQLSQDEGVNLEGIRRILALEAEVDRLQLHVNRLTGLLSELAQAPGGQRLFTATFGGDVHLGRVRVSPTRAITR